MPTQQRVRRSRVRRAGEGLYGVLLLVRTALMGLLALLLVVAGGWTSWASAEPALFGQEAGTVRVEECADDTCTGHFTPSGTSSGDSGEVTIAASAAGAPGEVLEVAPVPGTRDVVRTGPAGVLYAWVPLAGALLLATPVVAGGLRLRRTAWAAGLLGAAVITASWLLLML